MARGARKFLDGASILLIAGVGAVILYELLSLNSLYKVVFDPRQGGPERAAAVWEIAHRNCLLSRFFLRDIALNPQADVDSTAEAIRDMPRCATPDDAEAISMLLQPHVALILRKAAGNAIKSVGCTQNCVAAVLHYLERDWRGETKIESRVQGFTVPPEWDKDIREVAEILESVLVNNRNETYVVLQKVYGLGSGFPSAFAVHMVGTLRLSEACTDLQYPFRHVPPAPSVQDEINRVTAALCVQH